MSDAHRFIIIWSVLHPFKSAPLRDHYRATQSYDQVKPNNMSNSATGKPDFTELQKDLLKEAVC